MSLREKLFLALAFTLLALIIFLCTTSAILVLSNIGKIERKQIDDDSIRVQSYLLAEIERLKVIGNDWANWDETYALVSGNDTNYIERNINETSIGNFSVNTVIFAGSQSNVIWATDYDVEQMSLRPAAPERINDILGHRGLLHAPEATNEIKGLFMVRGQPALICSSPILRSNYQGPAAGSLIFIRNLDAHFLEAMSERVLLPVRVQSLGVYAAEPGRDALSKNIMASGERPYARADGGIKHVYRLLRDIYDQPAAVVEFQIERDTFRIGLRQLGYLTISILISALVFGTLIWQWMKQDVINRISGMNREVTLIKESGDVKQRISEEGRDEIAGLSREINRMLSSLQHQRSLSDAYLNVASIMIGILDRDGRIAMINPRGCDMLGFRRDELIGMDWMANMVPERTREDLQAMFNKIIAGDVEPPRFYQNAVVTRSGQELMISFHNELLRDEDGRIAGVIFSGEDVTDRQQREAERLRIEKLESLGVMAGGIAHDFNNTLTAILANIDLLHPSQPMPSSAEREEIIRDATEATLRARDLATQLLTFAKGGEPVREMIHLPDLVRNAVRIAVRGLSVQPDISIQPGTWPASVDITQISQVMHNLVINAAHAMPKGGRLQVSVINQPLDGDAAVPVPAGPYVMIEVRDEGHGIPPEDLGRIFDPYFTTKKSGSGLGLSTAYSIVRRHGGHITVASKINEGSSFRVYLPAQPEMTVPMEKPTAAASSLGRILVVDDDEVVARVIQRILGAAHYEVVLAPSSSDAKALHKESMRQNNPFHLVMTDLTMPGDIGGLKIFHDLRRAQPDLKGIVISGYASEPILADPAKYGFSGAIAKPFHSAEITQAVRRAMGRT